MTIERVSPQQGLQRMGEHGYRYLDVRSEQEFDLGHPEGAYNIPLMHMAPQGMVENPDFLAVVQAAFDVDTKLLVGCRSGQRSMRAARTLIDAGFGAIIEQRAGFDGPRDAFGGAAEKGWRGCGLPCATEAVAGRSYAELAAKI